MPSATSPLNILINGSGIAGPVTAYWLHRFMPTCQITILERAPEPRLGGQAVDLRSSCLPIVKKMGVLEKVKEKTTTEVGMQFVYRDGQRRATFEATGEEERQSATSEYEILRGDMARIVYELTKDNPQITYIFDEMAIEVQQDESEDGKALVTFKNGKLPPTEFDVVIGADGQMSRTRRMVFGHGPNNDDYLYRLGQYSALFTMLRDPTDTQYAQWYNASRGRLFLLRPDQYGTTRAYLAVTDANLSRFDELDKLLKKGTREEQQAWFEKEFEGAGWQTERCIREMKKADDFYMQQIAQVKMDTWHKGRVALVGDAAYCPSPISGVGTGAAIVGAYVLAGEISRNQEDIPTALANYERVAREYVDKAQKLIPGAPQIANPQTEWGIKIFNTVTGTLSHPYIQKFSGVIGKIIPAFGSSKIWSPPEYGS
ncbi:FAD/NAD(P)-binding domain-containing protein [Alternaria alternata]|uniref:FAD/NAD(P)-binding domain-containing protein n=1 Tax=Alternaria alternata TaxID=5599 RepID=A0A177DY46_ALTAL|nr:FAD/NAD(P)-binding domain-containing protein [Alternaria alternata]OAG24633.1 FAD/NAD(P)-binding domain-containing protein [Alternaria alternata]